MRPRHIWSIFTVCAVVVFITLAWISTMLLQLDEAELLARQHNALEENVRLALWRMDSILSPLVAQENASPYFFYSSFYPIQRAYTRMFAEVKRGEILMPSPLLTQPVPEILLHFQFSPWGKLSSPQVPRGNMRDLAEASYLKGDQIEKAAFQLGELQKKIVYRDILGKLPPMKEEENSSPVVLEQNLNSFNQSQSPSQSQSTKSAASWEARNKRYGREAEQNIQSKSIQNRRYDPIFFSDNVKEEMFFPLWVGEDLFLVRRVSLNGESYLQGSWLNWKYIRKSLLEDAKEILPEANLVMSNSSQERKKNMLATLPITLVPGEILSEPIEFSSPVHFSVLAAWICVIFAIIAVIILLIGVVSLSERRASFVSAVSHELRTPLTTLQMYTEMLSEGMVSSEEKRLRYIQTLREEANRLGHLVENVLTYARLDGQRAKRQIESVSCQEFLNRCEPSLAQHAKRSGMEWIVEVDEKTLSQQIDTDTSMVGQILLNLVDNACKYGKGESDYRLIFQMKAQSKNLFISICDHGPGISPKQARRLFKPFKKSAIEAAHSAPGIGLGLTLSRRLAQYLGGNLRLDTQLTQGTCFVLTIPWKSGQ